MLLETRQLARSYKYARTGGSRGPQRHLPASMLPPVIGHTTPPIHASQPPKMVYPSRLQSFTGIGVATIQAIGEASKRPLQKAPLLQRFPTAPHLHSDNRVGDPEFWIEGDGWKDRTKISNGRTKNTETNEVSLHERKMSSSFVSVPSLLRCEDRYVLRKLRDSFTSSRATPTERCGFRSPAGSSCGSCPSSCWC